MAHALLTQRTQSLGLSIFALKVVNAVINLINFFEKRSAARKAYRDLNSLSNRELNDIGISRCDIYNVTYGDLEVFAKDSRHTKVEVNPNLEGMV
jgi:uncharacterized protein YjiS (DUF1127 family)|tara:strand:- start:21 stop:305 length:285 start_codon:yes stop_codon:yes gene_type:complete